MFDTLSVAEHGARPQRRSNTVKATKRSTLVPDIPERGGAIASLFDDHSTGTGGAPGRRWPPRSS